MISCVVGVTAALARVVCEECQRHGTLRGTCLLETAKQRDCLRPSASLTLVLTKIEDFGFCRGVVSRFSSSQEKSSSVPSLQLPL